MARRHRRRALGLAALALAAPAAAHAAIPAGTPNTAPAGERDLVSAGPTVVRLLGTPESMPAPAALGHPGSPEDDLAAALDGMATAVTEADADRFRLRALEILEGRAIAGADSGYAGRPYAGIPLLNWNLPLKRKTVEAPPGSPVLPSVTVNLVRFGEHVLSDTALLDFADPASPFTITYRITQLDDSEGVIAPTPLVASTGGAPQGGLHSAVVDLGIGERDIGTQAASRFTDLRTQQAGGAPIPGLGDEHTRLATQEVTVRMPPAGRVSALLEPDLRPGHEGLATLRPATSARLVNMTGRLGLTDFETDPDGKRAGAIGVLAAQAPERQVWDALTGPPAGLAAMNAAGAQAGGLVDVMRRRSALPPGQAPAPGADVTVVVMNNEVYVSAGRLRMDPGDDLTVAVRNADGFVHSLEALDLHDRVKTFGPLDWGAFDWTRRATPASVAPGATATFTVAPDPQSHGLWVGDPDMGDQAGALIRLDRGPRVESLRFPGSFTSPLHGAFDQAGDMWVTLAGVDTIARVDVEPGVPLAQSPLTEFRLPGGAHGENGIAPPEPVHGPQDIAVDHRGIVWSTLAIGNGLARIDPALPESDPGRVRIYPLNPCPPDGVTCAPPPPPALPGPLTRQPNQMVVWEDADGNTVIAFTETAADSVGLFRVAPDGTPVNAQDVPAPSIRPTDVQCASSGCKGPTGIGADGQGRIWFVEAVSNRVSRMTLDQARPFDPSRVRFQHFPIPSSVLVEDPEIAPFPVQTAGAHSLAMGRDGRVWFAETETAKVGILDPALAQPGTSLGITEIPLPDNDFCGVPQPADLTVDRAGRAFVADEYGDQVASLTSQGVGPRWIPTARQSLTDEPIVDPAGDLWFLEPGAQLLTRVRGVSSGNPLPGPAPRVTVDTSANSVAVSGLSATTEATVEVVRGGVVVARRRGAVSGGAITVANAQWVLAAGAQGEPLGAGDRVRITAHGTMPPPPIELTVALLQSSLQDGPEVAGTVTRAGAALGGRVVVDLEGGGQETL
ncbi:MAG: hypothetical protein MUE51_12900, partial [Thermoleophilia bacterium]|nr:hypothetical protein [Thermoleophilia bacterium]